MPFNILSHTADTGIEATANNLSDLLCELATGMFRLMGRPHADAARSTVEVEVTADGNEELIVDALSELLYQSEVHDLFFIRFDVRRAGEGAVHIRAVAVANDSVELTGPPIKAVTYHDLVARQAASGWYGRVYFDV